MKFSQRALKVPLEKETAKRLWNDNEGKLAQ